MRNRVIALALALTLIMAAVAPVTALAGAAMAGNSPDSGNQSGQSDGKQFGPPGWAGPPDSVQDRIPESDRAAFNGISAADFRGRLSVSDHASTLDVAVTSTSSINGPTFAMQFRDDDITEGRRVALPADKLKQAIGHVPETATVHHSSGEVYSVTLDKTSRGNVVVPFRHFSTNTVTFGGTVNISATPATDGSQYSYDLNDVDSVSNYTINVTGALNSHAETESATRMGDGDSSSMAIAGNRDPAGSSVNGKPVLKVTGQREYRGMSLQTQQNNVGTYDFLGTDSSGMGINSEFTSTNPPENIDQVTVDVSGITDNGADGLQSTVDIWIVEEGADSVYGEGTKVATGIPLSKSTGMTTWNVSEYNVASTASSVTVEFVTSSTAADREALGADAGTHRVESAAPSSLTIDADDGTSQSITSLGIGSTASYEFPITKSATQLSVSAASGAVDTTLSFDEQTATVDPAVEVNGHTTSYTGSLNDGQTKSLTTDSTWVVEGTNRVNVTVGSVSADAPNPVVDLAYEHGADSNFAVDYQAEEWSERYNVSKTFASARDNVEFTVDHAGTIVAMRSVEMRTNGGAWQTLSSTEYTMSGATLEVQLGSVSADDTVRVRTAASKVQVNNGSIAVTDPTKSGQPVDSKFRVDSWNSDSYISVGGTTAGDRVHYTYNESWSADEQVVMDVSGSQHLELPTAPVGGTARVSTIPVTVAPATNEVLVSVDSPQTTEPKFSVAPGAATGDAVDFTYLNAQDGKTYTLYSETNAIVRDSGTASSPLTLSDDDSSELLQFQLDSSSSSSSGGSSGGAAAAIITAPSGLDQTAFIGIMAALLAAAWFLSNTYGSSSISTRMLFIGEGVLIGILALESLSPASILSGVVEALVSFAGATGQGVAQAMPLVVLAGAAVLIYWLRQRGKPERVVNFQLGKRGDK